MQIQSALFQKWVGRARRWSGGWRAEMRRRDADLVATLAREADLIARYQSALAAADQQLAATRAEADAQLTATRAEADAQLAASRAEAADLARQLAATRPPARTDLPSILSVTLPKSGTVYFTALFHQGLGHQVVPASLTYFPRDLIDWQKFEDMRRGGVVVPSHLDASPANLQFLTAYRQPIHLHLRDPRQATLSMTHHMTRLQKEYGPLHGASLQLCPTTPPEFCNWPLEARNEWMIAHYLPSCVTWIREWLDVVDAPGGPPFPVLLTTFEEMIRDEAKVVGQILDFFGIPADRYTRPEVPKTMTSHFRQGTPDEWRSVYTPAQQEAATRLIPPEWVARFRWSHGR